ncbi:MAG: SusC/RagA family TonB-linked outer membrane protein, partial [Flavobacteriaceae bacterium]|nr:SusC/RagA family TonB-linked outer membrane protein [Flavobacteriaceae bacterium]
MRTFIFLFCSMTFGLNSYNGFSQNAEIQIDSDKQISIEEIFELIKKQTDYQFVYDVEMIQNAPLVQLKKGIVKAHLLLKKGLDPIQCTFEFTSNTVIVRQKNKDESQEVQRAKNQQGIAIEGQINDSSGQPLPGANIIEKGTINGTQSDFDGKFSLTVKDQNSVLVISYIGYFTQEVILNNQDNITVTLEEDLSSLDEVVVVGYGSLSRSKILGAVSSIKSEDISQLPVGGVDESIAGRVAGVQVVTSGAPGSTSQIKVRGVGTITAGRSPLIVVDGYPLTEGSDLNAINPLDIESIEVLKDAASTAIYGSRGANGVIFVTTKSAKSDKTTFTFDTYTGFQSVLNPMKFLNAYQYAQMVKEARDWGYVSDDPANRSENDDTATRLANGARPRNLIPNNIDRYLSGTPGLTDNNWLDDVFQDGKIQSHNLAVSGRSGKTNWFVSGGYFNQEGLILGSGFERFTAKVNLETEFSDKIRFGINLTPSISEQKSIVEGWTDGPMQQAIL